MRSEEFDATGALVSEEWEFRVDGESHSEVVQRAHEMADQLTGGREYGITIDIRPGITGFAKSCYPAIVTVKVPA